jgi:PIN domain nuclease of toxin-antitoxin system
MKQPFLLDTCAALWIVADEFPEDAATALSEAHNAGLPTYVSPITAWEVGNLARKGRFKSSYTPQRWFDRLMSAPNTIWADLTAGVLLASAFLPGNIHNDPADRIIAATAREYGFTLMTRDKALLDYGREGHLSVLEC